MLYASGWIDQEAWPARAHGPRHVLSQALISFLRLIALRLRAPVAVRNRIDASYVVNRLYLCAARGSCGVLRTIWAMLHATPRKGPFEGPSARHDYTPF